MNLYLVQHAEAKTAEEDPERSLSEEGIEDLARITAFISQHNPVKVAQVFHSGKTRAQQTADVLAEHIKPERGVSEAEGLKPMAEPSEWADRLKDCTEDIMLVGHLPHLNRLSSLLVSQDEARPVVAFRNSGIVCLVREVNGIWTVGWAVAPEMLSKSVTGSSGDC